MWLEFLGVAYIGFHQYELAKPLLFKSLDLRESMPNKNLGEIASVKMAIAMTSRGMGDYFNAEKLYGEYKDLISLTYGNGTTAYYLSLQKMLINRSALYLGFGQYESAINDLLESVQISESVWMDTLQYLSTLGNLGIAYSSTEQYALAQPVLEKCMHLVGSTDVKYSHTINNILGQLTLVYLRMHKYDPAYQILKKTNNIADQNKGENPEVYILQCANFADYYASQFIFDSSELYITRLIDFVRTNFNNNSRIYVLSLQSCILPLFYEKNYERIFSILSETQESLQKYILDNIYMFSEYELERFINDWSRNFNLISLSQFWNNSDELPGLMWDNLLFYKALISNNINPLERNIKSLNDSIQHIYYEWKGYKRILGAEYAKPFAARVNVDSLEELVRGLERNWTHSFKDEVEITFPMVNWVDMRQSLKENEAIIEYVHFRYNTPDKSDSVYIALLLRPDWERPKWVYLCTEKQIETILPEPGHSNPHSAVTQFYTPKLYDLVWRPLDSLLTGAKKVYYSPSGSLYNINLKAIPLNDSLRLMDVLDLQYVSSGRNLVVNPGTANTSLASAVVYGGLQYDPDSTHTGDMPLSYSGSYNRSDLFSTDAALVARDTLLRSRHWDYLPQTEEELQQIAHLLKSNSVITTTMHGSEGTEESFKSLGQRNPSPEIIHVATHGYFFSDPQLSKTQREFALLGGQSNFRFTDNPLLRSGLILSGANKAWIAGQAIRGREDGILSAYEIAQMNLSNTKLVVLSACETALGEIRGNEGVYGLQRAFKRAGVEYLIMTLWSISDSKETVDFMVGFYRHLLQDRLTVREAFNQAQREMRKRNPDPYYWAGFVLIE